MIGRSKLHLLNYNPVTLICEMLWLQRIYKKIKIQNEMLPCEEGKKKRHKDSYNLIGSHITICHDTILQVSFFIIFATITFLNTMVINFLQKDSYKMTWHHVRGGGK